MATKAGLPAEVAQRIGDDSVTPQADIDQVAQENYALLLSVSPSSPGTPMVYDLNNDETVDLHDKDWLASLMSSA